MEKQYGRGIQPLMLVTRPVRINKKSKSHLSMKIDGWDFSIYATDDYTISPNATKTILYGKCSGV